MSTSIDFRVREAYRPSRSPTGYELRHDKRLPRSSAPHATSLYNNGTLIAGYGYTIGHHEMQVVDAFDQANDTTPIRTARRMLLGAIARRAEEMGLHRIVVRSARHHPALTSHTHPSPVTREEEQEYTRALNREFQELAARFDTPAHAAGFRAHDAKGRAYNREHNYVLELIPLHLEK